MTSSEDANVDYARIKGVEEPVKMWLHTAKGDGVDSLWKMGRLIIGLVGLTARARTTT